MLFFLKKKNSSLELFNYSNLQICILHRTFCQVFFRKIIVFMIKIERTFFKVFHLFFFFHFFCEKSSLDVMEASISLSLTLSLRCFFCSCLTLLLTLSVLVYLYDFPTQFVFFLHFSLSL